MMVAGLILFFGMHVIPHTPLKPMLVGMVGANPYRGLFSLVSLAGLVLVGMGYRDVPVEFLFAPAPWAKPILLIVMPVVFALFAAANMPTHIRKTLRHPMMIGTLIWSALHFMANGELAACYLFGAFFAYAVVSLVWSMLHPADDAAREAANSRVAWKFDVMALVGGIVVYGVIASLHGWLFGVSLV
jgi:uncharacterized membrane protein